MIDDHDPSSRKVTFPLMKGQRLAAELVVAHASGEVVELPIRDAAHRPLRGRVVAVYGAGQFIEIEAELVLQ